jgi:hypothetical protein
MVGRGELWWGMKGTCRKRRLGRGVSHRILQFLLENVLSKARGVLDHKASGRVVTGRGEVRPHWP